MHRLLPVMLLLIFAARYADAHDFCVDTAAGIQSALTAAQTNGEDDFIYIKSGNYALTAGLTFVSSEAHSLEIFGGHDDLSMCPPEVPSNLAGIGTTLDGQHLVRPLYLANVHGSITVTSLTIVGGLPAASNSGGGLVAVSTDGNIDVEDSTFFGNRATGAGAQGGAAILQTGGELSFVQNLVFLNRATHVGGVVLQLTAVGGFITAQNNTVANNTTDTLADPGGMAIMGGGTYAAQIVDNIVWNNLAAGGSDFGVASANVRIHNDIGVVTAGSIAPSPPSAGNLSVDPDFAPCSGVLCFNFELNSSSPLVNAGITPGGFVPNSDIVGKPRILGPKIDIGAFENDDLIFADGFGSP